MSIVITSVRDVVADRFLGFQLCRNTKEAVRGFVDAMKDVEHSGELFVNHPEDFQLWRLGWFDEETGEIESYPQVVFNGLMAKRMNDGQISIDDVDLAGDPDLDSFVSEEGD